MLVTPGWGGCLTEFKQMEVALKQLTEQGRHSDARRTLVCMMALFAAIHFLKSPSSEIVALRQEDRLHLQQPLTTCMVGPLHTV